MKLITNYISEIERISSIDDYIQEKLKINSKSKVSTEVETIEDFCKKYDCKFNNDSVDGIMEYNYLSHKNKKITLIIEDLLKYSWSAWVKFVQDAQTYVDEFNTNRPKYSLIIRKNDGAKLIIIDCEGSINDKYHLFGSLTLSTNNRISEAIDKDNDTKTVEMLLVKTADYILNIWDKK